ncbi:MAG: DUF4250 domain-containing protein [Plesiomonas shigelloides]
MMDLTRFAQMDSTMLMSIVNMKLRNEFDNLYELAQAYDIDAAALCEKLEHSGFHYHPESNQFRSV